ncbi:hypothetical protein [Tenuibacillus multivorans]|uniref:Uncharacterized protein n=1 Tax=Tenuibacillus multivorans TaxID=237069 RepID=A0A1G9WXA1_9BACI|nr:hypothetical protein [Tenuibacillus multivorans]GEL77322.1 hypothetical protein TMU01_15570 [Tenuibacillus multivorans]SDM88901.1 hypothetical protein SAMN05216498_0920 [Tenuibacillus multivorans]
MKRPYFLGGTTARGYYRFYDDLISQLDRVLYIEGGFTSIVHPILNDIVEKYEKEYEVGCVYNHIEPNQLEAVVIPKLKIAVIDRTKMSSKRLVFPKLFENLIYIGEGYDQEHLKKNEKLLVQIRSELKNLYKQSVKHFETALSYHHEVENIYIKFLNVDQANRETKNLIERLFRTSWLNKKSSVVHRYLGAATSNGPVDFVMNLTEELEERIYIKGRSGTGKSTMLKKIVNEAVDRGYDIEIYHCGFDPESLDMVIIRELSVAIFDATDPHEHEPSRSKDEIFDVYELFVDGNPDQEYQEQILELKSKYKNEMKRATEVLKEIQEKQRAFETIYQDALDEGFLQGVTARINNWVES